MNVNDKEFAMLDEVVGSIYNRGIKDGMEDSEKRYKQGLEDAWECARKVVLQYVEGGLKIDVFKKIFGESTYQSVLRNYTASEAMQKIKEYEERQKNDEKSCGTCKHVMRIDCGAYPCNECPRDTLPKWTPKQDEKCEKCTKEISAECVVDGCEFEAKQTDDTDSDDGSIKVGDEVINGGVVGVVTHVRDIENGMKAFTLIDKTGKAWNFNDVVAKRTGRNFPQIAEVLEQLRGEEE